MGIWSFIGHWSLGIRVFCLCFLRLLVSGVLFAPFAEFFQSDLALHLADVFARPVVVALADRALEADEIGLGHNFILCDTKCLTNNGGADGRD